MDKLDQIVQKLNAIHNDVTALQVQMTTLVGNGQPGRISAVETAVVAHDQQIQRWKGAIAILTFLLLLLGGTEAWHILHR